MKIVFKTIKLDEVTKSVNQDKENRGTNINTKEIILMKL